MRRTINLAVIAALIITGASAEAMVSATTVESHTDGKSIGLNLWGENKHYTDDLTVNVSGLGVNGNKYHNNVTGKWREAQTRLSTLLHEWYICWLWWGYK